MRPYLRLICFALLAGCRTGTVPAVHTPETTSADPFAVVAEADRLAERDLWPGFDPRAIPVAIYDGERTLLFRHPTPPAGFQPLSRGNGVWSYPGRYPSVTANSSVEIGGVSTATLMPAAGTVPLLDRAGILIHEAFHVHQREHHPAWQANEAELFTYPVDDPGLLALRRLEAEALRRALAAEPREHAICWGRTALSFRRERFARLPAGAAAYERGTEWFEGLANYVETRARDLPDPAVLPEAEFAPEALRQRGYATGTAIARLLDRFSPGWQAALQQNDSTALDVLLSEALAGSERSDADCAFTPAERHRIETTAAADVDVLRTRRADQRRAFLEQPGWALVVESPGTPLFPQGFDPLNVQIVRPGEVLHTRWLKLGNQAGTVEVLGYSALSEATGEHPLFHGVRRLTVAGLTTEPMVTEVNGFVTVQTDGLSAELRGAAVERSGQIVTIRLPSAG
jgi:hypothetical protein